MYTGTAMPQVLESIFAQVHLTVLIDIGITALLIYWLFSLIRGTRAVPLVIGVSVLFAVYAAARALDLRLLTQMMQAGAVVGLFALVVIFQPELRRALERIGRVGSFAWLLSPAEQRSVERVAREVAAGAATLSSEGHGALIVLERETGLEDVEAEAPARAPGDDPDQAARAHEIGHGLHDCLRRLLEPRRLAVVLHLQGHTVPEAARILDWAKKRVENLVYRGLFDLRRCLTAKGLAP